MTAPSLSVPVPRILVLAWLEIRKLCVTRSTQTILWATLAVGAGFVAASVAVALSDGAGVDASAAITALALAVTFGAPLLGVLIFTSDWQHRDIITVFLLEPRRALTFWAKLIAVSMTALTIIALMILTGVFVTFLVAAIASVDWRPGDLPSAILLLCTSSIIGAVAGSAFASALLNAPLAITAVVVQTLFVDLGVSFIPGPASEYLRPSAMAEFALGGASLPAALVSTVIWVLTPLAIGYWRHLKREPR